MQIKKRMIFLLFCGIFLLSGCAEPEQEPVYDSALLEDTSDASALLEEQGRLVQCTFETPEEVWMDLEIDAVVTVPETAVEAGEFEYTLPTVEQIEKLLIDGEKMQPNTADFLEESWLIDSGDGTGSIYYYIEPVYHMSRFTNMSVRDIVDPLYTTYYTDETCLDEEMAEQMQELTEKASSVYEAFEMDVRLWYRDIKVENGYYLAGIEMISLLDSVPLVSDDIFMTSFCNLSDEGIAGMSFAGCFTKKNAQEVSVLSIDQLLKILEEKAGAGEIDMGEEITSITLAYHMDFTNGTFYPVWCLYGGTLDIQVDAQTGEIL